MSRLLICIISVFFPGSLEIEAQLDTVKNPEQYVFPEFSVGVVRLKSNEKVNLALNYNVVREKMVFNQNNQIFDMINYSLVDTVYIHERKFVPFEKVFYEVLVNGTASLFIQHKGNIKIPPKPAAYGGTSEVSSSNYIDNIQLATDVYRMKREVEVIIEPDPVIWIRKDNKMYAVFNQKNLLKIFKDRKSEIRNFIEKNKVNTGNPGHLAGVV